MTTRIATLHAPTISPKLHQPLQHMRSPTHKNTGRTPLGWTSQHGDGIQGEAGGTLSRCEPNNVWVRRLITRLKSPRMFGHTSSWLKLLLTPVAVWSSPARDQSTSHRAGRTIAAVVETASARLKLPRGAPSSRRGSLSDQSEGSAAQPFQSISIRELARTDSALLDDLLRQLSPNSRYLRFHAVVTELNAVMRDRLLDVDGRNHIALVASHGAQVRAIARFIRDQERPEEAEIAISVADAWHRRNIGRRLLVELTERAIQCGVTRFRAEIMAGNTAARSLFCSVFQDHYSQRVNGADCLIGLIGDTSQTNNHVTMYDLFGSLF